MRSAQDGWPNRIGSPQVSQRTPPISMISQGLRSDSSYSESYAAVKGSHAMRRIRARRGSVHVTVGVRVWCRIDGVESCWFNASR